MPQALAELDGEDYLAVHVIREDAAEEATVERSRAGPSNL